MGIPLLVGHSLSHHSSVSVPDLPGHNTHHLHRIHQLTPVRAVQSQDIRSPRGCHVHALQAELMLQLRSEGHLQAECSSSEELSSFLFNWLDKARQCHRGQLALLQVYSVFKC